MPFPQTRAAGGRVIAVGTTSVRALECASCDGEIRSFHGETDLFILPGYEFRASTPCSPIFICRNRRC